MKQINLVNMKVDSCMDADDYGHRLTECIEQMSENTDVVNLVKIHIGDNMSVEKFHHAVKYIAQDLQEMGAKNCIFVPLKKRLIEDITIDEIEVKHVEDNNRTD